MLKSSLLFFLFLLFFSCHQDTNNRVGLTEITKWQDDKKAAISVTYDDGIINQFTIAKPIMDKLGLPATFYVITGKIEGSANGKFIGRDPDEIINETVKIKTNADNFLERASLIAFTGTSEGVDYHSQAGSRFEAGKVEEAYQIIDEGYSKIRNGNIKNTDDIVFHNNVEDTTTWKNLQSYAAQGHEIASHTVTHARLAVLDEPNLLYELEQSKADVAKFIGEEYTFSAECPYGTENERVMSYAHKIYPSLRNRMPESYLEELNRASQVEPGASEKEYVQWQRGPLTDISVENMQSWVDTCLAHDNIWLVLVFHGVNNLGWEPKTEAELDTYFTYMKKREDKLWIATFADVTKYIRERKGSTVSSRRKRNKIEVELSSNLDKKVYDIPLTLKTYIPDSWGIADVKVKSGNNEIQEVFISTDENGYYAIYNVPLSEELITVYK